MECLATAHAPVRLTVEPLVHVSDAVLAGTRGAGERDPVQHE